MALIIAVTAAQGDAAKRPLVPQANLPAANGAFHMRRGPGRHACFLFGHIVWS
jgi:hypothetical protein